MKLDYTQGAFRENGLVFVATIDATDIDGGKVQVETDGIDIHAHSTYVCDDYKSCVPYEIVLDPAKRATTT